MKPFTDVRSRAVPLGLANIDTDQLIPARFMKTPRAAGYRSFLLHDLRRRADGSLDPDFPLNDPRYDGAEILIAGPNFGCGSSREAGVYVLVDSGFRCVIAPSFADIFSSNAAKNGLLTARVSREDAARLMAAPDLADGAAISVDLASETIRTPFGAMPFGIREDRKLRLLNGWSDIDLTLSHRDRIAAHVVSTRRLRPWEVEVPGPPAAGVHGNRSGRGDRT